MAPITSEFRAEDAGSIPGVVYRYGVPANEQNAVMATLTVRRVSLAVFVRPRFTDLFAVLLTTPTPSARTPTPQELRRALKTSAL